MTVGVLAKSRARALHLIRAELFTKGKLLSTDAAPLSLGSRGHRGISFTTIFIDPDLWPLSENLVDEYEPCLQEYHGNFVRCGGDDE